MLKITDGVMRHMAVRRVKGGTTRPPEPSPEEPVAAAAPASQDSEPEQHARELRGEERNGQHQPRRPRRQPDPRPRAAAHAERNGRLQLRLAVNTRQKDATTGEWGDKPNYFDVTVWGNQGESCAQYLSKGRPVGVDGRLDWREWEAQDGTKRQAVEIIADSVQFLGGRDGDGENGGSPQFVPRGAPRRPTAPTSAPPHDDDIPF